MSAGGPVVALKGQQNGRQTRLYFESSARVGGRFIFSAVWAEGSGLDTDKGPSPVLV